MYSKYNNRRQYYYKKYNPKPKPQPVIEKLNIESLINFPELSNKKCDSDGNENGMNYIDTLNKEVIVEKNEENDITSTWLKIVREKNGINTYSMDTKIDLQKEEYDFSEMIYRWEKYKLNFIEIHGEDRYNKLYRMPNEFYEYVDLIENEYLEELYQDIDEDDDEYDE